jgi:hypothetical protein
MLKLLLDEHISPQVALGMRRRDRKIMVRGMAEWESGAFLGQEDASCLREAATQKLTLVIYDLRTIPPVLKDWAEQGRQHGGVIFVDGKTIAPANIGGLVQSLDRLVKEARKLGLDRQSLFPAALSSPHHSPATAAGFLHSRRSRDKSSMLRAKSGRLSFSNCKLSRST